MGHTSTSRQTVGRSGGLRLEDGHLAGALLEEVGPGRNLVKDAAAEDPARAGA